MQRLPLKDSLFYCIAVHQIAYPQMSAEGSCFVKEEVLTTYHQQVQLCGSILFDPVMLLDMYGRSPCSKIKYYQIQKTEDGKWKIATRYYTGQIFQKQQLLSEI